MIKSLLTNIRFYIVGILFAILALAGVWAVSKWIMPKYTLHNHGLTVPDITQVSLDEAVKEIEEHGLRYTIIDKRYNAAYPPEYVIDQTPRGGQIVKPNRRIYLTVNTTQTPKVTVPNVVNLSMRNAELQIKNYGLSVGNISYASSKFKNVVLSQSISSGIQVEKGTIVNLVISDGLGENKVATPDLVGIRLADAQNRLRSRGLRIGSIRFEPRSGNANVVLDFSVDDNTAIYRTAKPDTVIEGTTFNLVISEELRATEASESGVVIIDSTSTAQIDSLINSIPSPDPPKN